MRIIRLYSEVNAFARYQCSVDGPKYYTANGYYDLIPTTTVTLFDFGPTLTFCFGWLGKESVCFCYFSSSGSSNTSSSLTALLMPAPQSYMWFSHHRLCVLTPCNKCYYPNSSIVNLIKQHYLNPKPSWFYSTSQPSLKLIR